MSKRTIHLARILLCATYVLMLSSRHVLAAEPDNAQPAKKAGDFQSLFNGKDLAGWVKEGKAGFVVRDGLLRCTGSGNYPTWLRTKEVFENFVLRLEYRPLYGAEGGVFFSAPLHGRISRVGFDVRLGSNTGRPRKHSPGAIFEAVAPTKEAALHYSNPKFNRLEIRMDWPKLKVTLNGQVVQDLNIEEHELLRYRPRLGYIGLQDRGKPILFRNIEIKRLPDKVRGEWKSLHNGKDFSGWHKSEKNSAIWSVDDEGAILADKGHGYMITDGEYRNLHFETYIKSSPRANGGIFFRWKSQGNRGFEIQIEDIPDSSDPTGSIYNRVRAEQMPFIPGTWVLMQVFLEDRTCVVRVNGVVVAKSDKMPAARDGNISLQMHTGKGWVRWKGLRVRTIKPRPLVAPGM
ncbi:MAG: DUF1080 domain-containing protein [Planctomycetes bacterium]|nr:DUF1080 domain-containing protein [Planctomycetota bacterium]